MILKTTPVFCVSPASLGLGPETQGQTLGRQGIHQKKIAPTTDGSGGAVTDDSQKEHEASTTDFLRPTALEETLARGNHQRSLEKLFSD